MSSDESPPPSQEKELSLDEQLQQMREEMAQLQQERDRAVEERDLYKGEVVREKVDTHTGLRKRTDFFQNMERTFSGAIEGRLGTGVLEHLQRADTADELVPLLQEMQEKLKESEVYVIASDVSFLSLANDETSGGSHAEGNRLLAALGEACRAQGSPEITEDIVDKTIKGEHQEIPFEMYRSTGGDEFSGLMRAESSEAVEEQLRRVKESFADTDIEVLSQFDLHPNIDFGYVHISDVVEGYRRFIEEREKLFKETGEESGIYKNKMRTILNIADSIADRRASIQKGIERVGLLMEMKKDSPEKYERVISFLRKGAFSLSDRKIDNMIGMTEDMSAQDKEAFLLRAVQELVDQNIERKEKEKEVENKVVREVADQQFFKGV